ncbi:MAG: hypothetical protein KZQ85_17620 [Candidatus Thiodiazotropha sp. (ex Myrtea sp. 'scaly one' KF741663)]|nr:hypothetical protein [Candidatus Thiodiazotropha sp. (ex Myrtea sp. 'scaly one' KF741663)]
MSDSKEMETAKLNDELTKVFNDGSVFNASDDDLNKYLKHLCSGFVPNEMVRHREMNRCQVINTVKTFRFINSVERSNKIFTVIIIILTIATVYLTYQSITQAKDSSKQMERLVQSQEHKEEAIVNSLISQVKTQNIAIESLVKQNGLLVTEVNKLSSSNLVIAEELKKQKASNNALKRDRPEKRPAP